MTPIYFLSIDLGYHRLGLTTLSEYEARVAYEKVRAAMDERKNYKDDREAVVSFIMGGAKTSVIIDCIAAITFGPQEDQTMERAIFEMNDRRQKMADAIQSGEAS